MMPGIQNKNHKIMLRNRLNEQPFFIPTGIGGMKTARIHKRIVEQAPIIYLLEFLKKN